MRLVVRDITSAVRWARAQAPIDANRIYLIGTSGGGMAALLLAGRAPETWAGVSAWAGISDLAAWHREQSAADKPPGNYARSIEECCGGPPGASKAVDEEYRKRSPITWLPRAKGLAMDINAGLRDGHDGSVPISHSILAFNALADEVDRLAADDIRRMTEKAEIPEKLRSAIDDSSYGRKKALFRKTSGKARVTIFDGGHELVAVAAQPWHPSGFPGTSRPAGRPRSLAWPQKPAGRPGTITVMVRPGMDELTLEAGSRLD